MSRFSRKRDLVEHDNVHRWLVSYADYMTLLFALFVVLYAMAMVNEKPFDTITDSLGKVFQVAKTDLTQTDLSEGVLSEKSEKSTNKWHGDEILDAEENQLIAGTELLSNIYDSPLGTKLTLLEKELNTALYALVESGFSHLKINGDWLEIELNSGLLFPSGSSTATNSAKAIISVIYDEIGSVNNFIRIRGYTDNQAINNEVFSSNWELSVYRATAILHILEGLSVNPARMAVEGYGQYSPSENNNTSQGRAKNRKVVIAISKYGLSQSSALAEADIDIKDFAVEEKISKPERKGNDIKVIRLKNGGIRITTRDKNDG